MASSVEAVAHWAEPGLAFGQGEGEGERAGEGAGQGEGAGAGAGAAEARTSSSVASAGKVCRSAPSSVRSERVLVGPEEEEEEEESGWAWAAACLGFGFGLGLGLSWAQVVAAAACWARTCWVANFSARSFLSSSRRRSTAARSSACSRLPRFSFSSSCRPQRGDRLGGVEGARGEGGHGGGRAPWPACRGRSPPAYAARLARPSSRRWFCFFSVRP